MTHRPPSSLPLVLALVAPTAAFAADPIEDVLAAMDFTGQTNLQITAPPAMLGVRSDLGPYTPRTGNSMAFLSTGDVDRVLDPQYPPPFNEWPVPMGNQPPGPGCGLWDTDIGDDGAPDELTFSFDLVVPAGQSSLKFDLNFLSREYPEFVGQGFNDTFEVNLTGSAWTGQIVFDGAGNPVSIDSALFIDVFTPADPNNPDWDVAGNPVRDTGFDVDGATGWLTTTAPVDEGDTINLEFTLRDEGDGICDTGVLLDFLRFTDDTPDEPSTGAGDDDDDDDDDDDATPDPGCPVEAELTCGSLVTGNNGSANATTTAADYGPRCSKARTDGPELRYSFMADRDGTAAFLLSGLSRDLDMYLLRDDGSACGVDACVAASTESSARSDEIGALPITAGQRYYVMVEGVRAEDVSDFELEVLCATPGGNGGGDSADNGQWVVQGSGCSTSFAGRGRAGGFALALLLGLTGLGLARRRRTRGSGGAVALLAAVVLGGVALAPAPALAQARLDIQRFDPVPQTRGFALVRDAEQPKGPSIGGQFSFNYALRPLELGNSANNSRRLGLIDHMIGMNIGIVGSLTEWFQLGVDVPFLQIQAGDPASFALAQGFGHTGAPVGFGDITFAMGFGLLRQGDNAPLSLSLAPRFVFPTGARGIFAGSGAFGLGGDLAVGFRVPFLHLSGNLGFQVNTAGQPLANLQADDEFRLGLGVGVPLLDGQIEPQVEFVAATVIDPIAQSVVGIAGPFNPIHTPAEVTLAGYFEPKAIPLFARVGVGKGIGPGFGTPDIRVFAMVGLHIDKPAEPTEPEPPPVKASLVLKPTYEGKHLADTEVQLAEAAGGTQTAMVKNKPLTVDVEPGTAWTGSAKRDCLVGTGEASVPETGGKETLLIAMEPDPTVKVQFSLKDTEGEVVKGATVRWSSPNCIGCVPREKKLIAEGVLEQMVCPGEHEVFVEKEGYRIVNSTLKADPDTVQVVNVEMKPTKIKMTEKKIVILEKVFFDFDKDTLQSRSFELLDEVAATIKANPQIGNLEVAGHTDSKGDDDYNLDLSDRRAKRVRDYLIDKGVNPDRLISKGYGEGEPIDTNDTDAGRDKNRRVEFTILGK